MTTVQLELWHLVTILLSFFCCVGAFGKILMAQFERRLDERFKAQEQSRQEAQVRWDMAFREIEELARQNERDLLGLKVHLVENFVSRQDFIRRDSILELKIDGLAHSVASKFENMLLRITGQKESLP